MQLQDLLHTRYSAWALFTIVHLGWVITFQAANINIMLIEIYDLDSQVSTLVYMISSIGFLIATPIAGLVLERQLISRRGLLYIGYIVLSMGLVIRTGDFGDEPMIWFVIVGQILSGSATAILLCLMMPELVASIENQTELFAELETDYMQVYTSSIQVVFGCFGQALGMFTGQCLAQAYGYNVSFIGGGIYTLVVCFAYYIMCGTTDAPQTVAKKDPNTSETSIIDTLIHRNRSSHEASP